MTPMNELDRRTVLRATGATMAAVAVAGCSGGGNTETEEPSNDESGGDGGGDSDGDGDGGSDGGEQPSFDGYLENVGNYDGVVDETGSDSVTVEVGVEANDGAFGFGPAAVRVSQGTTVTWEWTGEGGAHNVVAEDGTYESELTTEEGFTFEYTFEESGTSKYYCQPHKSMGMKGVVVVE